MQPVDTCEAVALSYLEPLHCLKKWDRCRLFVNEVVSVVSPDFRNDAPSDVAMSLKLTASNVLFLGILLIPKRA